MKIPYVLLTSVSMFMASATLSAASYNPSYTDQNQGQPMQSGRMTDTRYGSQRQSNTPGLSDADRKFVIKIQEVLMRDDRFRNVTVGISDGVITLTGTLDSEADRLELKNRIRQEGDRKVNDQLTVQSRPKAQKDQVSANTETDMPTQKQSDRSMTSDEQLKQDILKKLEGGFFNKGYKQIKVEVHNGYVILRGTVDSESDKKTVLNRVQLVNGVKHVDDSQVILKP